MRPMRPSEPLAILAGLAIVAVACTSSAEPTATPATTPATTPVAATAAPAADPTPLSSSTALAGGLTGGSDRAKVSDLALPAPPLVDLVSADGTPFQLAALEGPSLVFFGYTHCPDVCPTTIGELFGVLEAEPDANAVFISVDPERDTPEFLAEWTQYFPDGFVAVTGSPGAIRATADNWGVKYARVETTSTAGYSMSHTADVFLVDEEGQLREQYPFGTKSERMLADLDALALG